MEKHLFNHTNGKSLSEVNNSIEVPKRAGFWKLLWAYTGPGALVAVGYMDPGKVMDNVGIPLIGVVPEDQNIKICGAKGDPLPPNCGGAKAYGAIAKRILGEDVPLTIKID